jgi:glycerol-3-phosphate acyltransferase PlsY
MTVVTLAAFLFLGYAAGSLNFAIIVTFLVTGKDIRRLGNGNPGTANVGRSVGKGWAALVFFGDLLKGMLVMFLARRLAFPAESWAHVFAVASAGMAVIGGHCRPLFFRFRGGRGAATAIGVYLFFIPAEIFLSMLAAFTIAMLALKRLEARIGRWTPMLFILLAPFLTWLLNSRVDLPLFGTYSLGGHPRSVVAAVFAVSCFLLLLNAGFIGEQLRECRRKLAGK